MEPPIFFASPEQMAQDTVALPATEAHHAVEVLRLKQGDLVIAVDGLGNGVRGELRIISAKKVELVVHTRLRQFGEPSVLLTLAAGLSVGYKFDEVVERGTQLGVSRFVPLLSEKSRVKMEDPKRIRNRTERLEKVALAAMKQCRRSFRPEIAPPLTFKQFMMETGEGGKLLFHPAAESLPISAAVFAESERRVTLLIGPESGFSVTEIALAREKGYQLIGLGKRILRTENAAPVAVALVMAKLGEFN